MFKHRRPDYFLKTFRGGKKCLLVKVADWCLTLSLGKEITDLFVFYAVAI